MPRITRYKGMRQQRHSGASMRPGRYAPDNTLAGARISGGQQCFNEAGALCPG